MRDLIDLVESALAGAPRTWFHWTSREFKTFKPGEMGIHFGSKAQANDVRLRNRMGPEGRFIEARLSYDNPFPCKRDVGDWSSYLRWTRYLEEFEVGPGTTLELTKAEIRRIVNRRPKTNAWGQPTSDWGRRVMRPLLESRGFDAIEYMNNDEGTGRHGGPPELAVMVFHPYQIDIVGIEETPLGYKFEG